MGCDKIAYAHHRDDLIETMLLSLLYEGRFYAFSPYTWLDRMELTVIRPLLFVREAEVIGFCNKYRKWGYRRLAEGRPCKAPSIK